MGNMVAGSTTATRALGLSGGLVDGGVAAGLRVWWMGEKHFLTITFQFFCRLSPLLSTLVYYVCSIVVELYIFSLPALQVALHISHSNKQTAFSPPLSTSYVAVVCMKQNTPP